MTEVMAKGPNFIFAKKFILEKYGPETWEKVIASLPPDAARTWAEIPLVTSSYPFSAFKAMVAALSKEVGLRKDNETARLYEYIAEHSISMLYKIFFQLTNPSFVIKNYPKLWSRFFDSGQVDVPLAEKGHAVVRFVLPEIFLDWLAPACLGYSKKAVEMAGGRYLTMHETGRKSLPAELWEITYELNWNE